jgi:hypothetical protein
MSGCIAVKRCRTPRAADGWRRSSPIFNTRDAQIGNSGNGTGWCRSCLLSNILIRQIGSVAMVQDGAKALLADGRLERQMHE